MQTQCHQHRTTRTTAGTTSSNRMTTMTFTTSRESTDTYGTLGIQDTIAANAGVSANTMDSHSSAAARSSGGGSSSMLNTTQSTMMNNSNVDPMNPMEPITNWHWNEVSTVEGASSGSSTMFGASLYGSIISDINDNRDSTYTHNNNENNDNDNDNNRPQSPPPRKNHPLFSKK